MPFRRVILVFLKWPEPGRVKTRLAAEVGAGEAAEIYRHLAEKVVGIVNEAPADEIRILFDPPGRESDIRAWLEPSLEASASMIFQAQASGDLGDRLGAAFESVFQDENTLAVAIGTDCIEIDSSTFEETWSILDSDDSDAVFGPARDGGYYLVGLGGTQAALFADIPWSTAKTLPATLEKAEASGLRVALLDQKRDIDTLADWRRTQ